MKQVPLSELKDDLSRFLREAAKQEIVITRHGRPAGVLIGFGSEDDWFDYRLENDPRFLHRIDRARQSLRAGRGTKLENLDIAESPTEARVPPSSLRVSMKPGDPMAALKYPKQRSIVAKKVRTRRGADRKSVPGTPKK